MKSEGGVVLGQGRRAGHPIAPLDVHGVLLAYAAVPVRDAVLGQEHLLARQTDSPRSWGWGKWCEASMLTTVKVEIVNPCA